MELESDLGADMLHRAVLRQNVADNALKLLVPANLNERAEQLRAQAQVVPMIADDQRELPVVCAVDFAQPANAENLVLSRPRNFVVGDQRHLAVVIIDRKS